MGSGLLPQMLNENIRVPRGVPARFPLRGLHRDLSKAAARHRSAASGRRNLNPYGRLGRHVIIARSG